MVLGSIFCYRSLSAIPRKNIGEPKEEIINLNRFECMYLSDLKIPYFKCSSSISIKVIPMGTTPQPSSLEKHSFSRLMRMPRASKDWQTFDLGCGSLTQHSNCLMTVLRG
jgi:hypothetical protein